MSQLIKEFLPLDVELEQISYDKKLEQSVHKLAGLEENIEKSFKSVAHDMEKANNELKKYLILQRETLRSYVQFQNQKSNLINSKDIATLKDHVTHVERAIEVQIEMVNDIKDVSQGYKEYSKTLKDYGRKLSKLNKYEANWKNTASEMNKARSDQMVTGSKLEKIENQLRKEKSQVQKQYHNKSHSNSFVVTAVLQLNQAWQKLKSNIKNFSW
ncbi:hypothetical protein DSAG12_00881 [Promethearchaeum syntrophicum]|uniref:Chromosome partition protein Smc n=1 Tax=Promethearchaeum syntrophicum TaxID=2594042 RepID=A0A5B9D7B1_9ARCH|nr:hypothetical protein [Candidatus Prometheoarchaeum syntrophicum]QEE15058.1 hypothetical protein DSAG12_00881 [Candidatus Prometheoarchaeum syntrophicum]